MRRVETSSRIDSIEIIKNLVSSGSGDDDQPGPFYLVDLEEIYEKHMSWTRQLPRVTPHYAVKCNPDVMLIKLLAYLGAGFDCASRNEIELVLEQGVDAKRIVFGNPCKQASFVRFASRVGVEYMTFDNENELYKIKRVCPRAKCVLRMIADDADSVIRLSVKFGADSVTSKKLIRKAVELGLDLVGVSFHVGSGQSSPKAFVKAIVSARDLFDYAREKCGKNLSLLDLGGGFPGSISSECQNHPDLKFIIKLPFFVREIKKLKF